MTNEELVKEALEGRKNSYNPYSKFAVGAAVLCKDGTVFRGCNIENSSYGLCMCAERNALFGAYVAGKRKEDLVAIALIADTEGPCSPCGACRQVMEELLPVDAPIIMANLKGDIKVETIKTLLPYSFSGDDLK